MTIVKEKSGDYKVVSHTGKNLGSGLTHEGAVKRLKAVEYFKNLKKHFHYPEEERLEKEDSGISMATSA